MAAFLTQSSKLAVSVSVGAGSLVGCTWEGEMGMSASNKEEEEMSPISISLPRPRKAPARFRSWDVDAFAQLQKRSHAVLDDFFLCK